MFAMQKREPLVSGWSDDEPQKGQFVDVEFDDGGTPEWRARHPRVIDVGKPDPWAKWRALPFSTKLITWLFLTTILPILFFIFGFGGLVALNSVGINPG